MGSTDLIIIQKKFQEAQGTFTLAPKGYTQHKKLHLTIIWSEKKQSKETEWIVTSSLPQHG